MTRYWESRWIDADGGVWSRSRKGPDLPQHLYGKRPGQVGTDFRDLITNGLIEMRYFEGEQGRGGEVMRFRISDSRAAIQEENNRRAQIKKSKQPKFPKSMKYRTRKNSSWNKVTVILLQ